MVFRVTESLAAKLPARVRVALLDELGIAAVLPLD